MHNFAEIATEILHAKFLRLTFCRVKAEISIEILPGAFWRESPEILFLRAELLKECCRASAGMLSHSETEASIGIVLEM